ncbi:MULTISPECIES: GNAT family N-acetyltransferase [Catenuloplanes]|uniref:GNAT superfamily N-acetyltransferase n=1 Tax=Catenuloplanes niger TaxID=587534 RepID=A0AAE4CPP8_9ACTN|nr:GNAT family N-acetyltransferase [Catenuloplanes niger]MDR7320185.1 GNAT superfamily N-acetyltransferase [Catenuloplanes niger]
MSREDLVVGWGRGWARSRRIPAVVTIPGGLLFDVGRPGHRLRYLLHTWDPAYLRELGEEVTTPGAWIKLDGSAHDLRAALPAHWEMFESNPLMTASLTTGAVRAPRPFEVTVQADHAGVLTAEVRHDRTGDLAASGRLAPGGGWGVIDQVETVPEYRRRGLGTVVIRALSDHAARRGIRTGVLAATADGHALYRSLGWTVATELAAAFIPEP